MGLCRVPLPVLLRAAAADYIDIWHAEFMCTSVLLLLFALSIVPMTHALSFAFKVLCTRPATRTMALP